MFKAITLTMIVALSACQLIVSFSGGPESGDQCKDTVDNDGNGVEDCKDPKCAAESFCSGVAVCGDDVKNGNETCDDGNTADGDMCPANCMSTPAPECGNKIREGTEQCDDGNADELVCTSMCTPAVASVCGNSVLEGMEECDYGTDTQTCVSCRLNRQNITCGDDILAPGVEQCDDHNTVAGDGCSPDCKLESSASTPPQLISGGASCSTQSLAALPLVSDRSSNVVVGTLKSPSRRVAVTPSGVAAVAMLCDGKVWVSAAPDSNPLFQAPVLVSFGALVSDVEIAAGAGSTLYVAAVAGVDVEISYSVDGGRTWIGPVRLNSGIQAYRVDDVSVAVATDSGTFNKAVVISQGLANGPIGFAWSNTSSDLSSPYVSAVLNFSGSTTYDLVVDGTGQAYYLTQAPASNLIFRKSGTNFDSDGSLTGNGTQLVAALGGNQLMTANSGTSDLYWYKTPLIGQSETPSWSATLTDVLPGSRRQIAANDAGKAFIATTQIPGTGSTYSAIVTQFSLSSLANVSAVTQIAFDGTGPSIGMPTANAPNATGVVAWTYRDQVFVARVLQP
jgi:cysteine-rich repeat protein